VIKSSIADTAYQDSTGVQDSTYQYKVAAVDTNGTAGVTSGAVGVKIATYFVVDSIFAFSQGIGNGQFSTVSDMAIAQNGDIYIVDQGNARIQVLNPSFSYKRQFASRLLWAPMSIALDSASNSYVMEGGNIDSLFVFDTMGSLVKAFTVPKSLPYVEDIGITGDELYAIIADSTYSFFSIARYNLTGIKNKTWSTGNANCEGYGEFLTADSGNILVSNPCLGQITVFDTIGNSLSSIQAISLQVAFEKGKGRIYANVSEHKMNMYDEHGNLLAGFRFLNSIPSEIAIDRSGTGYIYELFDSKILRLHCLPRRF
jgi:hypothetical protein